MAQQKTETDSEPGVQELRGPQKQLFWLKASAETRVPGFLRSSLPARSPPCAAPHRSSPHAVLPGPLPLALSLLSSLQPEAARAESSPSPVSGGHLNLAQRLQSSHSGALG